MGAWSILAVLACTHSGRHTSPDASAQLDAAHPALPTSRPLPTTVQVQDASSCNSQRALELYQQKIEPLFQDDHPSTCSQCHLPGIDLGSFVRGTPCETLACLVDQQLVDPGDPSNSKILSWIGRAKPDSKLITKEVIAQEHDGFEEWIRYNIECGTCGGSVCPAEAGTSCDLEPEPGTDFEPSKIDPGGCSEDALEAVFRETVYSHRGRCSPCHFDDHVEDENTPQWIEVSFGCEEGSKRTLKNVIELGLIDVDDPSQSLLLLKPLAVSAGGVKHGGGDKFEGLGDSAYEDFSYFAQRYAACANRDEDAAAPYTQRADAQVGDAQVKDAQAAPLDSRDARANVGR